MLSAAAVGVTEYGQTCCRELMIDYLATTDATGELPLYDPDTYARALESGHVPGRRSRNGR